MSDTNEQSRNNDRRRGPAQQSRSKPKVFYRKKVCKICKQNVKVDYKDPSSLRRFITDRGKILPRRITGSCAKHQRLISRQVKRARIIALIPFAEK